MAGHIKALIVDDSELTRLLLQREVTASTDWEISISTDGAKAWSAIEHAQQVGNPISVVLSDWNMPMSSGLQLLQKIRSNSKTSNIYFVMITSETEAKSVIEAVNSGANDYVLKPFNKEKIQEKLKEIDASLKQRKTA